MAIKSFTNFAGTSHQLYSKKLVTSKTCSSCGSHEEKDSLYVLCCENSNMHIHWQEIINNLQLTMLGMACRGLTPLRLLEFLCQEDEIPEIPRESYAAMKRVDRRNTWHGFFPAVLSTWVKWEYRTTKWLEQFLVVCIETPRQLWMERCRIFHECATSRIMIEDRHILLIYVRLLLSCTDADSNKVLK